MLKDVPTGAPPPAVREQQPGDEQGIRDLVRAAYRGPAPSEGDLGPVDAGSHGFVAVVSDTAPGTDMAGVTVGRIVGYVGLRPGRVGDGDVMLLDPVAVVPDEQHKGVATYLVQFTVEVLADTHAVSGLVVLDDAPFWSRFGFRRSTDVRVTSNADPGLVQVLSLRPEPLRGVAEFAGSVA